MAPVLLNLIAIQSGAYYSKFMAKIKIRSKRSQRILGLLLFVLGLAITAWIWKSGISQNYILINASMLFPAFMVMGLGLLFFPFDSEKLKEKWGDDKIESVGQVPGIWWIIIAISILIGIVNYFALVSI